MKKFIQFYNVRGKNYTVNINYILTIESTNEREIFRVCIKDIGAIEINRNVYDYLINYLLEQSVETKEDTRKKIRF